MKVHPEAALNPFPIEDISKLHQWVLGIENLAKQLTE